MVEVSMVGSLPAILWVSRGVFLVVKSAATVLLPTMGVVTAGS
jgi:hypothetical protein